MSAGTFGLALGRAVKSNHRRARAVEAGCGIAAVVVVLLLWELLARTGALPAVAFPPASSVLATFGRLLASPVFWQAVGQTLLGSGIGLAAVCAVALPLGIAMGRLRWVDKSTLLLIEFLKPIPPVALLPLALLFYGPSLTMKVVLVFLGALWPLLVQVVYGARGLDTTQLDLARSYRLGGWKTIRRIVLPTLTPFALTGLRVAATIAIIVSVVAELIGGAAGLGQEIALAQNSADLPTMYAYIVATGLLGLAVNTLFTLLGRPLLFWHPSQRTKEK